MHIQKQDGEDGVVLFSYKNLNQNGLDLVLEMC